MHIIIFGFIFLLLPLGASATQSDICDILNLPNCRGVTRQLRRNTFQTAPTTSTASNLNPANVSFDKGLGVEAMAQANNPVLFSLTSGTGKMGGALISGAMDNSFFGNRTPELDEDFRDRHVNDKQYKNKKYTFALGAKLLSQKNVGLDLGVLLKRHSEVKKINPGVGVSGRFWLIHFGASMYRDDMFINFEDTINEESGMRYSDLEGKKSIDENFLVTTFTIGTRIKNFAFDMGTIKSKLDYYDQVETNIVIYSGSFYYKDFLFNLAMRKESSGAPIYEDGRVQEQKEKSETYYGIQYSLNRHIIFGVNYNYFLLNEMSATVSLFI